MIETVMGRFPCCSICIESFRDFTNIAACVCGHTFHHKCFIKWSDQRRSQGQSSVCPTCQQPAENKPAGDLIPKLFSFDIHGGPINFDDEFLTKLLDQSEKLESEATVHKAEINRLRRGGIEEREGRMEKHREVGGKGCRMA